MYTYIKIYFSPYYFYRPRSRANGGPLVVRPQLEGEVVAALRRLHVHYVQDSVLACSNYSFFIVINSGDRVVLLCSPELTPQMVGGEGPSGLVTLNESTRQLPMSVTEIPFVVVT